MWREFKPSLLTGDFLSAAVHFISAASHRTAPASWQLHSSARR